MLSLGLSIDFRDLNLNQISGLSLKGYLKLLLSSVHLKVQERHDQLPLGSSRAHLEMETKSSKPIWQWQSRFVNCNLEKPASPGES